MKGTYWSKKKAEASGKITVSQTIKRVEFLYKGTFCIYEYISTGSYGFSYIYINGKKIYGPHNSDCTELGREIEAELNKQKIK